MVEGSSKKAYSDSVNVRYFLITGNFFFFLRQSGKIFVLSFTMILENYFKQSA